MSAIPKRRESGIQRIKLRISGSPVKLDATIIAATPDMKEIKVRFDAEFMEDAILYAWIENTMLDVKLKDNEVPGMFPKCRRFEVL